jgi:hypothetical protein
VYEEMVELRPNITLTGDDAQSTIIQFEQYVVIGAENTVLRNCTVTVPGLHIEPVVLVDIDDVVMELDNVILDGNNNPYAAGVQISGESSSASTIHDCLIQNMNDGVWAVNSGVTLARNTFENIFRNAIFVFLTEDKQNTEPVTPLVGTADDALGSGMNRFRRINGSFVYTTTPATVVAQFNDWGEYDPEEVADKVSEEVIFEPFFSTPIEAGSIIVQLVDEVTGDAITPDDTPTAYVASLDLWGYYEETCGLLVLDGLDEGTWTVLTEADDYGAVSTDVGIEAAELFVLSVALSKQDEGEGEGAGEIPACAAGPTAGQTPWSDLLVAMLLLMGLALIAVKPDKTRRASQDN